MDRRRELEAIRQAHQREVNEASDGVFVCECGDPGCTQTVSLSLPEYEKVRAFPNHFVIATNHENPEVEWVVSESERFAIVETLVGEASKIARRTDPRALYSNQVLTSP
jgi:hypothetical protein